MGKRHLLTGDIIAISGDFGKPRSAENLKRWIEGNGGRYSTKVEDGVTHLICSKEHWKSQPAAGKTSLSHQLEILAQQPTNGQDKTIPRNMDRRRSDVEKVEHN